MKSEGSQSLCFRHLISSLFSSHLNNVIISCSLSDVKGYLGGSVTGRNDYKAIRLTSDNLLLLY